ncbi:MAG: penicillin-binding protein activator, partial [Cypionkella sp.]|nr:penicillin-binding protein activator [Cypionkella sp.]
MLSVLMRARKSLGQIVIATAALVLAACVPAVGPTAGDSNASSKIQVALLVPAGSGQASDELLARSLQNAARMAISDLGGAARVDLRVYNTAGQPATAAAMATQAVADGAQVILGPVFAQEANAAGVA